MPRRIDIELTSALSDGSWTWRAAGAREPKGTVESSLLPDGANVGDELKVEVEQGLDGIEILSIVKGREKSGRELLELLHVEEDFKSVIEKRAQRPNGDRRALDGNSVGRRYGKRSDGERSGCDRGGERGPRKPRF